MQIFALAWEEILEQSNEESEPFIAEMKKIGRAISNYLSDNMAGYIKGLSYVGEFEGLRAIMCNRRAGGSRLFDAVWDEKRHDIMIAWIFSGEKYFVSLYTTKADIDVSEIAAKYGGGGHKGAAGFTCNQLPW